MPICKLKKNIIHIKQKGLIILQQFDKNFKQVFNKHEVII